MQDADHEACSSMQVEILVRLSFKECRWLPVSADVPPLTLGKSVVGQKYPPHSRGHPWPPGRRPESYFRPKTKVRSDSETS